jgi:hypothetical protein
MEIEFELEYKLPNTEDFLGRSETEEEKAQRLDEWHEYLWSTL